MTEAEQSALTSDPQRFLLDQMLGTLAVYLRMCGYNTAYAGDRELSTDDQLLRVAAAEDRVILSRDRELVARADRAIEIQTHEIEDQLAELDAAGVSLDIADPPRRCGRCNGELVSEPSSRERPEYAPSDPSIDCWRCRRCGQYFWKGSHWADVADRL